MRHSIPLIVAACLMSGPALPQTTATVSRVVFTEVAQASMLASSLKGLDVMNAGGQKIGDIEDLVVANDAVTAYIVEVGGFLGIGSHYVAVSPKSLAVSWSETDKKWHARLDATKDQLQAAPQFKYEGRFAR